MLRATGSARVMAEVGQSLSGGNGDGVLRAVLGAIAGQYELLAELGRGVAGTIMFLARELDSSHLVVLRLDPAQSGYGSVLSVVRELDASVPGAATPCPDCGATTLGWGRYCPSCGSDLADVGSLHADLAVNDDSPAARELAIDGYEILGSIERAGGRGVGVVHFARDLATGSIAALVSRGGGSEGGHSEQRGFRVVQSLRPIAPIFAPGTPAGYGEEAGEHELPSPQPPRAQPTPHRALRQEVLIPSDELASPDDRLPPRPVRPMPRWWIAAGAAFAAAVILLAAFVKARVSQPDGTDARIGSGEMGVALTSSTPVRGRAPTEQPDSGYIRVSAQLPRNATVTINGLALPAGSMALVPGEYVLAASAPGYATVSERLALEPGQTLIWMPTLPPIAPEAASTRPAAKAPVRPAKKTAVGDQSAPAAAAPVDSAPRSCRSAFDAKDWALAATLCSAEARSGDVTAQRNLGVMYDRGVGVARDPARAADWLRRAAGAGSRDASYQLGAMYESGRGVEKDEARAVSWYRRAALLGDRESQVKVGKAYEQGLGVASDMGEALTWYRKAAAQGDAWAQNYIGFLYGNGKGVPKNDAEALRWFRRAAANGNAQAEYNVGFMYANGRGVGRSEAEAVRWYEQAASHGYEEAAKELERRGIKP